MARPLNIAIIVFLCCILFTSPTIICQTVNIEGQVSGWTTFNDSEPRCTQVGLRYIPHLDISKTIGDNFLIDVELSANMYGTGLMCSVDDIDTDGKTKPYRLWLRFSGTQFEARVGLQKINFGSASLLRPLMWFDRIDPRDPLQLTDGVYGVLGRYYFLNNANIWLWGLYGDDETKGWEVVPSDDERIEYGGRFQYPLGSGELGVSYHHRETDPEKLFKTLIQDVSVPIPEDILMLIDFSKASAPEHRFGIDGKWDMEIGLWFEGVLIHQDIDLDVMGIPLNPMEYRKLINIGCDYTLGLGNGLHALGEHLILELSEEAFGSDERHQFSGLSLSYPIGLIDNISGILYHDWENEDWYRFINWQRTYDNWRFYLMAFWNPEQFQMYQIQGQVNTFAGKGIQVMAVFNH